MNKKKDEEENIRKQALADSFWERVNTLIKNSGKTQREISLLLDKDNPRKLQNWTAGKRLPDAEEAAVIAKSLNTTVEYLLAGEDSIGLSPESIMVAKMYESTMPRVKSRVFKVVKIFAEMNEENTFFADEPPVDEDE